MFHLVLILVVLAILIVCLFRNSSDQSKVEVLSSSHRDTQISPTSDEKTELDPVKTLKPRTSQKTQKRLVGEEAVCLALERLTGKKVNRGVRPNFLKNPETGRNLEIDCYIDELKIGVEYNGIQHYQYPNPFHSSKLQFTKQIERDNVKRHLCDNNGVYLIPVPCTVDAYQSRKDGGFKHIKRSESERYSLIYNYLSEQLSRLEEVTE